MFPNILFQLAAMLDFSPVETPPTNRRATLCACVCACSSSSQLSPSSSLRAVPMHIEFISTWETLFSLSLLSTTAAASCSSSSSSSTPSSSAAGHGHFGRGPLHDHRHRLKHPCRDRFPKAVTIVISIDVLVEVSIPCRLVTLNVFNMTVSTAFVIFSLRY